MNLPERSLPNVSETLVNYRPGDVAQALDVMKYLSGAVMLQVDPSLAQGDIEVDLGSTVDVSAKAPTPTTAPTTAARPDDAAAPTTAARRHGLRRSAAAPRSPPPPRSRRRTVNPVSAAADQEQPWDPRAC